MIEYYRVLSRSCSRRVTRKFPKLPRPAAQTLNIYIYGSVPLISADRRGRVPSFAYGQGCPVRGTTAQKRASSKQPAPSKKKIQVRIKIPGPCRKQHGALQYHPVLYHMALHRGVLYVAVLRSAPHCAGALLCLVVLGSAAAALRYSTVVCCTSKR